MVCVCVGGLRVCRQMLCSCFLLSPKQEHQSHQLQMTWETVIALQSAGGGTRDQTKLLRPSAEDTFALRPRLQTGGSQRLPPDGSFTPPLHSNLDFPHYAASQSTNTTKTNESITAMTSQATPLWEIGFIFMRFGPMGWQLLQVLMTTSTNR